MDVFTPRHARDETSPWPHCLAAINRRRRARRTRRASTRNTNTHNHTTNLSETYQYYTLPFCLPAEGKEYKFEDLGEVLEGDRLVSTPYEIKFKTDVENQVLCTKALGPRDLAKLRTALTQDYYFQVRVTFD